MTKQSGETTNTSLIERYLCTRGQRYFRGQHDREFFFVANTRPRRLHVHLEMSRLQSDVFTIRVSPACFFPAADRARLTQFAESWNRRNSVVAATVHPSSDPQRVGVDASKSQPIAAQISFEEFAAHADRTIAAAIDFFGELTPVPELPSTAQPLLRDAG